MEWRFAKTGVTKSDPSHLGYFNDEALRDAASALIREDIQNRLDAKSKKSGSEPVLVRYYVPETPLAPEKASRWLNGLLPHLNSPQTREKTNGFSFQSSDPLPYCVIECFRTKGLSGNPHQKEDPTDDDGDQDFFWFMRNVGRSKKKKGDRGRWGLGKVVYPASSKMRTFFGYSVNEKNNQNTLMGRSVLCIHSESGKEYDSEGYGGQYLDKADYPAGWRDYPDDWPSPCTDQSEMELFREDFGLDRGDTDPGLSLVIPCPKDDITYESIFDAVISQYFWEILRGTLECVISDGARDILLDKSTLMDEIQKWPHFDEEAKQELRQRLQFCKDADGLSAVSDTYFELRVPKSYGSPKIEKMFVEEGAQDKAKKLFGNGNLIMFECPVVIKNDKNGTENNDAFLVYLQKTESAEINDEIFIRDGLTISGESAMTIKGIRALVLAEGSTVSEFLGDSENPAHTKWLKATEHFKGKYAKGGAILDYVKKSAFRIANFLSQGDEEISMELLSETFGIDDITEDIKPKASRKKGKVKPPIKPKSPSRKKYITSHRLKKERGFRIQPAEDATDIPDEIRIQVAYDTEHGSPLSKYHPADFDLNEDVLIVDSIGCHIVEKGFNQLRVKVLEDEFSISVCGFDGQRDLFVRATPQIQSN